MEVYDKNETYQGGGIEQEQDNLSFHIGENEFQNRRMPIRKRKKIIKAEKLDNYVIPYLRKGRQDLCLKEKIKILELLERDQKTPQRLIASSFKVSQSQISRILNNRDQIMEEWKSGNVERKRNRKGKGGMVESKLLEWYNEAKVEGLPVSGPTLMEKAKAIGEDLKVEFTPTSGWFSRWKSRNGIVLKVGKNQDGSVSYAKVSSHWRRYTFTKVIKGTQREDVWFLDSLALFSNVLPQDLNSSHNELSKKGRLNIIFAFNYSSTNRKRPLIVGTESVPIADASQLSYFPCVEGHIPPQIFTKWLLNWDKELKAERRRISLFLSKAPYVSQCLTLQCISLHYYPEGDIASLRLQPFHCMISSTFISLFRYQIASHYFSYSACKQLRSSVNSDVDPGLDVTTKVPLLDRVHMIRRAWKHIHPDVFIRGIVKAGLSRQVQSLDIDADVGPPQGMSKEQFNRFVHIEEECSSNPCSNCFEGQSTDCSDALPPSETHDFEALLACNSLRKYLQNKNPDLVDEFAKIESAIQRDLSSSPNLSESLPAIDPLFDPSSFHCLERHGTSVIKEETSREEEPDQANSEILDPPPILDLSDGSPPNYDPPKYPEPYPIPTSNAHEVLLSHHTLKPPTCTLSSLLPPEGQAPHTHFQAGYLPQDVELKGIPIGVSRPLSDVGLDRFTIRAADVQQTRVVNDLNPHLIPATPITNSTPTFITFASPF